VNVRPDASARGARVADVAGLVAALGVAAAAYGTIVFNYFHGDDFLNLEMIVNNSFWFYVLQPFGGHVLLGRDAVFWITHAFAGTRASAYFASALAIHLVNVALVYLAARRLGCAPALSALVAGLWGAAPVQEGTLGWYSAFGMALASVPLALLLLVASTAHPAGERRFGRREWWTYAGLALVAAATFGVGLGIAMALPFAVRILVGPRVFGRAFWVRGCVLIVTTAIGYFLVHQLYDRLYHEDAESGLYAIVGGLRFWWIPPRMLAHLLLVAPIALVGGHLVPIAAYPSPGSIALSAAVWVLVASAVVAGSEPTRRYVGFALALMLGTYGMIALGRAVLAAILSNAPAFGALQARYQYAPTMCLALVLAVAMREMGERLGLGPRVWWSTFAIATIANTAAALHHGWRIDHFEVDRLETKRARVEISAALARARPDEPAYVVNRLFAPAGLSSLYFGGLAGVYTIFFADDPAHPIYFVESNEELRRRIRPGTRLARVIVAPPR
jgi:hypothetical protein